MTPFSCLHPPVHTTALPQMLQWFCMLFSRSFIILDCKLNFDSFWNKFCVLYEVKVKVFFLIKIINHSKFIEKTIFYPLNCFGTFVNINGSYKCLSLLRLFVLYNWHIWLSLCCLNAGNHSHLYNYHKFVFYICELFFRFHIF